ETEGVRLIELILDLRGAPDKHSLELTEALLARAMPAMMGTALPWLDPLDPAGGGQRGWLGHFGHRVATLVGLTDLEGRARFCYGLSHGLLGPHVEGLGYPPTAWRHVAPRLLRILITPREVWRRLCPGATRRAIERGSRQIQQIMKSKRRPPHER